MLTLSSSSQGDKEGAPSTTIISRPDWRNFATSVARPSSLLRRRRRAATVREAMARRGLRQPPRRPPGWLASHAPSQLLALWRLLRKAPRRAARTHSRLQSPLAKYPDRSSTSDCLALCSSCPSTALRISFTHFDKHHLLLGLVESTSAMYVCILKSWGLDATPSATLQFKQDSKEWSPRSLDKMLLMLQIKRFKTLNGLNPLNS